ncbi:hypothetical protein RIR_jg32541.t1 [Rhizophagus irregularis DAOM 181602=DAOM 197198]|nr:hypothetical protein RIR_jg32541.t1 [Rhizophagus irregularis DAOM 181602=DAOM 197198]
MKEWFIKHAESHEVIQKYYALNNVIEKRVKEENREVGEQVRAQKRESSRRDGEWKINRSRDSKNISNHKILT